MLRLIQPGDAEYTYALRTNPDYNSYLSQACGTAEDQRRWIEAYKVREAAGLEYYYMIVRHDGRRCGLVRLYEIGAQSFKWGSWILDSAKPPKAALESAVLSFGIGFQILDRAVALVDVRVGNKQAIQFYRRLGMLEINRTQQEFFFIYARERFEADSSRFMKLLCDS